MPDPSFSFHRSARAPSTHDAAETSEGSDESEFGKEVGKNKKRVGDWQAYLYYISSIGRRNTLVFLSLCLLMVLGLQLPRTYTLTLLMCSGNKPEGCC